MNICQRLVFGSALCLMVTASAWADDDEKVEKWFGTLDAGAAKLRIAAEVTPGEEGNYTGHAISMDQNNAKEKFDSFTIKDGELRFEVKSWQAKYVGKLNEAGDEATGTFAQGRDLDFTLRRVSEYPTQVVKVAWVGIIDTGAQQLKVQFRIIVGKDGKEEVVLDSLSQGATNIVATMEKDGKTIKFTVPAVNGGFEGELNDAGDTADGIWSQNGVEIGLELKKQSAPEEMEDVKYDRPQHPQAPFPYEVQTVKVENADAVLAGTLTYPKGEGPFPAVVLVTGSGPQDRDETVFGHKPFLVIADYLTRQGIAVLRILRH